MFTASMLFLAMPANLPDNSMGLTLLEYMQYREKFAAYIDKIIPSQIFKVYRQ